MNAPARRAARCRPPRRGRPAAEHPCKTALPVRGRLYCPRPPSLRHPVIPPPVVRPRAEVQSRPLPPEGCLTLLLLWLLLLFFLSQL